MQGIQGAFVKYYEFLALQPEQYVSKGLDHVYIYDHDFRSCQNQRKPEFYDLFQKAYDSYHDGDWMNAQGHLTAAAQIVKDDGPTQWMLNLIDKSRLTPPDDWIGIRNIDAKLQAPEMVFMREDDEDQDVGIEPAQQTTA